MQDGEVPESIPIDKQARFLQHSQFLNKDSFHSESVDTTCQLRRGNRGGFLAEKRTPDSGTSSPFEKMESVYFSFISFFCDYLRV
jgi:hypothetical protein